MTTRLIGLESGPDSAHLLVARLGNLAGDELTLEVAPLDGESTIPPVPVTGWQRTRTTSRPRRDQDWLNWTKPTIDGLEPGHRYRVRLVDQRQFQLSTAIVTTTPADDTRNLRLIAGSCFDVKGDHTWVLDRAYDDLVDPDDNTPTYNLWLGDQVYVDAPWYETATTAKSRSIIFDRYLLTWGLRQVSDDDVQIERAEKAAEAGVRAERRPRGASLYRSMARTSNWFLPDDHEFWNGYPNPGWLTLFGHTLIRTASQTFRWFRRTDSNPHPATQGRWGAAAGEAYLLFASPFQHDGFTEEHSPKQLQVFGSPDVVVIMVDTRWHRTILKRSRPGASDNGKPKGFMNPDDLARLVDLLETDTRLVCLGLARPIIGHLPHRGLTRSKVEYGAEDFPAQYEALWRALATRRRDGLPTLTVAGDVHHHAIRTADDDGLLEIVSSPMAILEALDGDSDLSRLQSGWRKIRGGLKAAWLGVKRALRWSEERLRPDVSAASGSAAYPIFNADGHGWEAGQGSVIFEARTYADVDAKGRPTKVDASGLTSIEIDSTDDGHRVTVNHRLGFTSRAGVTTLEPTTHVFHWSRDGDDQGPPAWRQ